MMIYSSSSPHRSAEALDDATLCRVAEGWRPDCSFGRLTLLYVLREVLVWRELGSTRILQDLYRENTELVRAAQGKWPVPEVDAETGRRELVASWRAEVEQGVIPSWTRRGPPSWLEREVWSE